MAPNQGEPRSKTDLEPSFIDSVCLPSHPSLMDWLPPAWLMSVCLSVIHSVLKETPPPAVLCLMNLTFVKSRGRSLEGSGILADSTKSLPHQCTLLRDKVLVSLKKPTPTSHHLQKALPPSAFQSM